MPSTSTLTKRRKPTRLLTSSISKASVTILNALTPLLLLRLSWSSLLKDPVSSLAAPLLPSIFILQTAFIILLLPLHPFPSKSSRKRASVRMDTLGDAIKAKAGVFPSMIDISNFQPLIQSLFLLIPATLLFYTIIILFGAPLTTHLPQTLLTALHVALLSTYPLSSSIIPSSENLRQLITLEYHADIDVLKWAYWGGIGTIVGAWLGAVPIPLDWDREWQVFNRHTFILIS